MNPVERAESEIAAGPTISRSDLRVALDNIVCQSLRPVSLGLGLLYILFAASHILLLPQPVATPMSAIAAGTAAVLLGLCFALGRWTVPSRWSHPVGAGIAGLVLLNSLVHLYLTADPLQTTNLILLIIGTGFLFLSARWFALTLAATLVSWGFVATRLAASPVWLHFGFALLTATVLAVLVHTVRVRTLQQLERLRLVDGIQKAELEQVLGAVQRSQAKLQTLLESASEAVALVGNGGRIEFANSRTSELFGYEPDELVGQPIGVLTPQSARDVHERHCAGFFHKPHIRPMGRGLDLSGQRKDGTRFPVEISLSYVRIGDQTTAMALVTDITERKRAEKALQEYSERLEEMVEERTRSLHDAHTRLLAQHRLQQEVELAVQVQASLLPRQVPSLSGFKFATAALPARFVSGDLYDFVLPDPQTCYIVLADIAGKGIPAALLVSTVRALVRAETDHEDSPAAILSGVNATFYEELTHAEMFVTFVAARLDARLGTLTYASAGHTKTLWWQQASQSCRVLTATGLPIGVFADTEIGEEALALRPGDTLMFYSDGVIEATNPQEELFGLDRLIEVLSEHAYLPASDLVQTVVESVEAFQAGVPLSDDLTLVVLKALPRTLGFSCAATLDHLGEVTTLVRQVALAYGDGFAYEMALATSEIVTNVIKHAYRLSAGEIRGQVALLPDRVQLDLYDDGTPFDLASVPAPDLSKPSEGRYGLHITLQMTDELVYTPSTLDGNHWRLVKLAEKRGDP